MRALVQPRRKLRADNDAVVARLRAESERKNVFMAVLAHELRNCMAPLSTALQILAATTPASPQALSIAQRQLHAMEQLVGDLLDVARVLSDQIELTLERLSLQELIAEVVQTCRPAIEEKRQGLSIELPDQPVHVNVDRVRFWQVLSNLMTNAAKFGKPAGHITMAVAVRGDEALISVTDEGVGIAAEDLCAIFELFHQEQRSKSMSRQGLGIGLAVVRRLVELHGGTVCATSRGPGTGATFTVCLPLADANVPSPGRA
jgi:signal transduction histidine kinase